MAKDPALLWYPGDWLGGTTTLSRLHKGAYMDLLMCQFNEGHMSLQDIKVVLGNDFDKVWDKLSKKSEIDENGLYFNKRLEEEQIKRKNFTTSRKKNLHKDEHITPHMSEHMENENENENINVIRDKNKFLKPTHEELKAYFEERGITSNEYERYYDFYESKNWMVGKNKMKDWKSAVRNWIRGMKPTQKSKYYTLINGKEVDVEPYQNYFNTETHPEDYAGKTAIGGVAMKKDIKQR